MAVIVTATYFFGIRPGSGYNASALDAVLAVPTSHAMATLEKQREQLIAMSVASHTISLVGKPSLASRQPPSVPGGGGLPGLAGPIAAAPDPGTAQSIAWHMMSQFGWSPQTYFGCLNNLWTRESSWLYNAVNPTSGAYGIPQALPPEKMASAGADWLTDPATQIKWGLGYIQAVYGDPCSAWAHEEAAGWY